MTNLVQSLFRIDPTEGLVQYVNSVKPYHSKVLDVLVEYIYREDVKVSIKDRWSWHMTFTRPDGEVTYTCGYGLVWDPYKIVASAPSVNIISAQAAQKLPLTIRSSADETVVSISQNGFSLATGATVSLSTTGILPVTMPQVAVGVEYTVTGHNSAFTLTDPVSGSPIRFLTNGTGTLFIEPTNLKFNSFLVEPDYGPQYTIALTNKKANQCTFVKTFNIAQVNPSAKQWTLTTDVRPLIPVADVAFDDVALSNVHVAHNCCFVFVGNKESYFQPGVEFTVTGSSGNDGTYVVDDSNSGRVLTRFDGKNTIVPVKEAIAVKTSTGTARIPLDVIIPNNSTIHVTGNTGIGGDGHYTVMSTATVGGYTRITVKETVSLLAAHDGQLHVAVDASLVPAWPLGLRVQFHSTNGNFPSPLSENVRLYYIPTKTPGVFNLSTKRYPTEYDDYVDLTGHSTGVLSIQRAEVFNPGAYVNVVGSYLSKNDGNYIIRKSEDEGEYVRLYVMEKIPFTTPASLPYDGYMQFNFDSFDAPVYCPVSDAPDLHTDAFIRETIMFEYGFSLTDTIRPTITDRRVLGYGSTPYGSFESPYSTVLNDYRPGTSPTVGRSAPTGTILPHGIDMQLFDIGGIDETVESVRRNYGRVV